VGLGRGGDTHPICGVGDGGAVFKHAEGRGVVLCERGARARGLGPVVCVGM